MIRLLIGAVLSEILFNLMYGGSIFYPYHQNVLWTFLLSLGYIVLIEKSKKRGRLWLTIPVAVVVTILGTALGFVTMVDYFGFGVLIVLVFYFSADTNGIIMCCSFSAYFISMRCCPVDSIIRWSCSGCSWKFHIRDLLFWPSCLSGFIVGREDRTIRRFSGSGMHFIRCI